MTEAEFQEQKTRIDGILNAIIQATSMDEWTIRVQYRNDEPDTDDDDWEQLARVSTKWQYREASMVIYVPTMSRNTDAEIQSHLIHELLHIAVSEMREWRDADDLNGHSQRRARDHEERVVTSLTRLIRHACISAQEGQWQVLRIDDQGKDSEETTASSAAETEQITSHIGRSRY